MNDITYVGLDVHKATVCVAIAESGRGGEVREVGIFENRPDVLRKMVARLGKQRHRLNSPANRRSWSPARSPRDGRLHLGNRLPVISRSPRPE